jgi:hypothetical protein
MPRSESHAVVHDAVDIAALVPPIEAYRGERIGQRVGCGLARKNFGDADFETIDAFRS